MMRLALLALLVVPTSCKRGTEPKAEVSEETRPGTERGSAGGFSASLSADLEVRKGSGDFFDEGGSGAGSGGSGAGAGSPGEAGSGSAGAPPSAGSGSGAMAAGSADTKVTDTKATDTKTDAKATDTKTDAKATDTKTDTKTDAKATDTKTDAKVDTKIEIDPPKAPIAMTAELKAIKLSLLPNWKRDVVEPATISLEVDVQSKDVKETFKFRYGYEDAKAPTDREAFKKYLADAKILKVTTDRQRGAAWYLEGSDGAGQTAFRLVVTWGGRRLYCGGSAYKTNDLGDIRDEVVVQAKKICETVAL
jgi:hypothetical protein